MFVTREFAAYNSSMIDDTPKLLVEKINRYIRISAYYSSCLWQRYERDAEEMHSPIDWRRSSFVTDWMENWLFHFVSSGFRVRTNRWFAGWPFRNVKDREQEVSQGFEKLERRVDPRGRQVPAECVKRTTTTSLVVGKKIRCIGYARCATNSYSSSRSFE